MSDLLDKCKLAKSASRKIAKLSSTQKNEALIAIANALVENSDYIIEENKKDLDNASQKGIGKAMMDRLALTKERICQMADGIRQVCDLADPIGEVDYMTKRPNGLIIGKKRVPLGVIGIIYEARPNVTADAAVLCLKTSNIAILRGGSEAIHSNIAVVAIMNGALSKMGFAEGMINLIEDTSRDTAEEMMRANEYIDVLIPRGGAGLIKTVINTATVPVIETGTGNCHIFVDDGADFDMAIDILINAKTTRPAVCNAAESLLIHQNIANEFLPLAVNALWAHDVEVRGCGRAVEICADIIPATVEDYAAEFLDFIISVKIVDNIDEAMDHIAEYSTGHSECIVTRDYANSQRFLEEVNSAAVYVNASTRFTDGFEFGFGAEIGISTQKLHARGPMGLKELTTTKYIIYGNGQIR